MRESREKGIRMEQFNRFSVSVDKNLRILAGEDQFFAYLGLKKLNTFEKIVYPGDLDQLRTTVEQLEPDRQEFTCFRIQDKNKNYRWVSAHLEFGDTDVSKAAICIQMYDIRNMEEDISESSYDQMTGVLNKQAIIRKAHHLAAKRPYEKFILCVMDIDNFKSVNDVYGHMRGDEVIIDVAHIIREQVGKAGSVGRIGGDEFMILLEHAEDEQSARSYLKAIRLAGEALYAENGDGVHVTVTIGAVLFPDHAHTYEELFLVADKMLYIGKMKGRNRYIIYTPELHGNMLSDDKVANSSYRKTIRNKTKFMMELFEKALHHEAIILQDVMNEVVCHYNLDAMYFFFDESDTSVCGRIHENGIEDLTADSEMSMSALHAENIGRLFNEHKIAILEFREMKRDLCSGIYDYIEGKGIRYMIIYRMDRERNPGHIVYVNRRDNSRKFADSDVTDLTYISKILEVISENGVARN